jgi:hypothetical protein
MGVFITLFSGYGQLSSAGECFSGYGRLSSAGGSKILLVRRLNERLERLLGALNTRIGGLGG